MSDGPFLLDAYFLGGEVEGDAQHVWQYMPNRITTKFVVIASPAIKGKNTVLFFT